jgi:hypothetical protein
MLQSVKISTSFPSSVTSTSPVLRSRINLAAFATVTSGEQLTQNRGEASVPIVESRQMFRPGSGMGDRV